MAHKKNQSGFSIMELMVAMALMLVVMSAIFSLMRGVIITSNTNYQLTDANQGIRNSEEYLSRDLLVAGDGIKSTANIWVPTDFSTKYLTARNASEIDPSSTGYTNIGMVFSDFNVPAGTQVLNSASPTFIKSGTDRITILSIDNSFSPMSLQSWWTDYSTGRIWIPGELSQFSVGEIYYLSDGNSGTFGTITSIDSSDWCIKWEDGDPYGLNRVGWTGNIAAATYYSYNPSTLLRVQIIQYFVDTDGRLIRRVFGVKGAGLTDSVIAEHMTSLQFKYILQATTNGTTIYDKPSSQVGIDQKNLVRLVEPSFAIETAYALQDGQKSEIEGRIQIGIRNLQFLEAAIPKDSEGNTALPNVGPTPFVTPTPTPTPMPTPTPFPTPTTTPTPTPVPTVTPTSTPTPTPTPTPTATPTPTPTPIPTPTPGKDG